MSQNQSTKTIFQAGSEWLADWSAGNRRRFAEIASQRNDAHHYDEALLFVKGLLILCVCITLGFGIYFHYSIFSAAGGNTIVAVGASLLLFIVAEVLKVVFGQYTMQGLVNGVAFKMPLTNLLLTLCFGALTVGAFIWSIKISTKSVQSVNLALNTSKLHEQRPFTPPSSIAILDAQIAAADEASAKAQKSTWRKRPTAEGLAVMQSAEQTKLALIAQRKTEWDAAYAAHQASMGEEGKLLGMSAATLGMIGGCAEYVTIFLLLIIALLRNKCYHENLKAQPSQGHQTAPGHYDLMSKKAIHNPSTIGFNAIRNRNETPPPPVGENRETPVATTSTTSPQPAQPTISHNSHKVVTEVVEDLEGVVMELCEKFKKEWPTRWRERVAKGGNLTTMQTNFTNWHDLLSTYLEGDHKPLSAKAQARVEEFRKAYREEILPTIQNT